MTQEAKDKLLEKFIRNCETSFTNRENDLGDEIEVPLIDKVDSFYLSREEYNFILERKQAQHK